MRSVCPWLTIAVSASLLLTGCVSPSLAAAKDFKAAEASGADDDRFFVALISNPKSPGPRISASILETLRLDRELKKTLIEHQCGDESSLTPGSGGESGKALPAVVLALVAAGAQFAFERWVDARKDRIEEITEAAKATYDATLRIDDPNWLAGSPCLLLLRYGVKDEGKTGDKPSTRIAVPGMTAVLKLDARQGPTGVGTVSLVPVYVRFFNAVAVTKAVDKPDLPVISASFAVSMKAVGREVSTMPRLLPAGDGTVTLAKIPIGKDVPARTCGKPSGLASDTLCRSTDLVPYPTDRGPFSLTVAIAEQGVTGFNAKKATAALDALKAALGPAISEGIKGQWGD